MRPARRPSRDVKDAMDPHDVIDGDDYFYRRAEAELDLAQRAIEPAVVRAHYEMANRYLDLVYGTAVVEGAA